MKKIVSKLLFGLTAAAGMLFAGCSDPDAAMDSIPYDRVLTPLNFSAEVVSSTGTDVTFSWSAMQNAEGYELEIFAASEEPDYNSASPIFSASVEPNEVPYTVALEVDMTYYARVRGISSKVAASNWAYPEKANRAIKTYAVRPSLNPAVLDRDQTTVTLGWDDTDDKGDLTLVRVAPVLDAEATVDYPLTAAELDACTKVIDDLEPGVNYKLTLIFGQSGQRGYVTAWTRPDAGQAVKVSTAADIVSNVQGATGEVTLLVAYNDGAEYDFTQALADPANPGGVLALSVGCDLTIIGDESVDGKKPVLNNVEFTLVNGATKLRVENLALNGNNKSGTAISITSGSKVSAIELVNCELYDYTKAIYSTAAGVTVDVDHLLISGVYAHDINANGANGGDFIDVRSGGTHAKIDVVNSTFYAVARTFLRVSDNAKGNTVNVENCTFNFVTATDASSNNAGIFHVRETSEVQAITCTNCLFLNMFNEKEDKDGTGWIRIARNNATQSMAPLCENNYYYRVGKVFLTTQAFVPQTGQPFSAAEGWTELAADPCVNSDAGKLYLTDGTISAKRVGDPRWWNASEPVVVRPTELEVVEEAKTWDFTDKTKYDTESVTAHTIIDNIRIYAPAEIVISQGITFPAAAAVNASGIPTSSALGFKATGYGSVTVTTTDGGYNASVHVLVGSDRITLPADGKAHKAVFGDLTGVNDIYVLAGSQVTVLSVTWTPEDTEAEETKTALATPAVTLDPMSITEGNEDGVSIVATWSAVENAATYEVTFNGKTSEITATTYTISAADAAALKVGEYELTVVAKPVTTSTKYKASAAAVVALNVKAKPVVGAPVTWTWDFSSAEWQAAFEAAAPSAKGTNVTEWTVSLDGLTYTSGTGNGKWDASGFIQPNGAGSKTSRVFSFTAPAAGTLKITAQSANSSETRNVAVVDASEKEQLQGVLTQEELEFDVEAGEVYIYPKGGIRFYKFEFTFIDGSAPAVEPIVWDFSQIYSAKTDLCTDSQEYKLNEDGTVTATTATDALGTLYFSPNGKKISIEKRTSDSGVSYFGFKYGGAAAYAYLNVDTPGTLTIEAVASGDAGNNKIRIDVNDTKGTQVEDLQTPNTTDPKCNIKTYTFEIDGITELSKVKIMKDSGGNSPEIYLVSWTPAN